MATISPEELIKQLESYANNPQKELEHSPVLRERLYHAARRAFVSFESPQNLVARILSVQKVDSTMCRIAIDLRLFEILADSESPMSLAQLAEVTKADASLLKRILHSLVAFGLVIMLGPDQYISSPSTTLLANHEFAQALTKCTDFLDPIYAATPSYLAAKEYEDIKSALDLPVQHACNLPGQSLFDILASKPETALAFGKLMTTWGDTLLQLHDVYPVERLLEGFKDRPGALFNTDNVMFIDVGGAFGHRAMALKKAHPELSVGRFINQDTNMMLQNATDTDGVEMMEIDFLKSQPIRGARTYYIRQCLHNWQDEECIKILKNLREVMSENYSILLIHECVVPEDRPDCWTMTQDLNMMAQLGTRERTLQEWQNLLLPAGLDLRSKHEPKSGYGEWVLEVMRRPFDAATPLHEVLFDGSHGCD